MNHYDVTIRETLEVKMKVAANSREEAEQLVNERWKKGDYISQRSRWKTCPSRQRVQPAPTLV